MSEYNSLQFLPTAEDLPETDNIPVDNELQVILPTLLRSILSLLWANRQDWFFGVNLGIYYNPGEPAIGPDGFLSLGVERYKSDRGRLSYVLWEESNIVPDFVLEIVSKTPGGEYGSKSRLYAEMGVLYYAIYNPDYWQRDRHEPFEVYRLETGEYVRQTREPVWMPELELGLGRQRGTHDGLSREWLYWYDREGERYPAPADLISQERNRTELLEQQLRERDQQLQQERQLREQEQQFREDLLRKLRERGINPDTL